jgi:hypothetical protein
MRARNGTCPKRKSIDLLWRFISFDFLCLLFAFAYGDDLKGRIAIRGSSRSLGRLGWPGRRDATADEDSSIQRRAA